MSTGFPSSFKPIEPTESTQVEGQSSFPSSFKPIEQKPSLKENIGRHVARTASRAVESLAGLPGDIVSASKDLASSGLSRITGQPAERIKKLLPGPKLPTSQNLKDFSKNIFGDIVTPQGGGEEFADEIVSDAAALAIPIKGRIPFLRSIGTALAGNLAQEGVKKVGGGQGAQSAAKIGTFFLSGVMGRGGLKKFWNKQYDLAEKAVPKEAVMDASILENRLDNLHEVLVKGGIETPSQRAVVKPLEDLRKIIKFGEIPVEDAIAAKKKLNELRASLFDEVKGEAARKGARTKLNDISKALDDSLEKYGKENPEFFKHYTAANEAYGGYQQSRKVGKWISKMLPFAKNNVSKVGLLVAEKLLFPGALPATLGGYAALKTGELVARMFKNPTLRKYYSGLIQNSIKENRNGFLRNLKGIDAEIQKDPDLVKELSSQEQRNE